MKFRPYAALLAACATAAASLALVAPADAAGTDPVTNLSVSQSQVGQNDVISASWTPNDTATNYRMYLSDLADGSDSIAGPQDVNGNSTSITTSALADGATYYVAVKSLDPGATVTTQSFTALTLDRTGPTGGSYQLNHTSAYLVPDFSSNSFPPPTDASFVISQTALPTDDTTPSASITRSVHAGDGTIKAWTATRPFNLTYSKAGSFHPFVRLTDQFGNFTDKALPTVTVKSDTTAPRVHIRIPLVNPYSVASWRHIRGTASDTGSGLLEVGVLVIQKRGTIWYIYDFHRKKWIKGYAKLSKTIQHVLDEPAFLRTNRYGNWQTPYIVGLRRGPLHVEAIALDNAFNIASARPVNRTLR